MSIFFFRIIFLKIIWNICKKNVHQNQSKQKHFEKKSSLFLCYEHFASLIISVRGGLRPLHPLASDYFGVNPPSQLVIGYHWLAFLNQVRKNVLVPDQFTTNVEYKIDHILKTKNRNKKTHELKNPFQSIAHLLGWNFFFQMILRILNDHISKLIITKISKSIFHLFQNIVQVFGPK